MIASESQNPTSAQPASQSGGRRDLLAKELRALASDPQIAQQPDKLAELGAVLLKLAASKQKERASAGAGLLRAREVLGRIQGMYCGQFVLRSLPCP